MLESNASPQPPSELGKKIDIRMLPQHFHKYEGSQADNPYFHSRQYSTLYEDPATGHLHEVAYIVPDFLKTTAGRLKKEGLSGGHFVLHSGYYGSLPSEWQEALDEYTVRQYKDVNSYIQGPGPERDKSDDLVSFITDGKGNILATLAIERRRSDDHLSISKVDPGTINGSISDKTFSTQAFLPGVLIDPEKVGLPENITINEVGELTRFTVARDKHLPPYIRYMLQAHLVHATAVNLYRHRLMNPDDRVEALIGNINLGSSAQQRLWEFLNGRVVYCSKKDVPSLDVHERALNPNDPEGYGYASNYMNTHRPKLIGNRAEGLAVFGAHLTDEDLREIIRSSRTVITKNVDSEKQFMGQYVRHILRKSLERVAAFLF